MITKKKDDEKRQTDGDGCVCEKRKVTNDESVVGHHNKEQKSKNKQLPQWAKWGSVVDVGQSSQKRYSKRLPKTQGTVVSGTGMEWHALP
mmetsp:Transcript_35429/g.39509  ORF Transcript_35429/g.39509 Transcript_35429/m.39509 type:complete len:90 (+) Transcript_35429:95-364(+)